MKRVGYVWEEVIDINNCEQAVLDALRRKKKTKYLTHVKEHYKAYGKKIRRILISGWVPSEPRRKTINEGTGRKERRLKIPSLIDHFIHTAVARVLRKHLSKRFYFYSCGSLPARGQTFACKAVEGHLRKKRPRYCALADVRKFYDSLKKEPVMRCLRRVFKDEKFLRLNEQILDQMGDGMAIGFTVSHWYAHLVLSFVDHRLKRGGKKLFLVRFMDNYVLFGGRKRFLHQAVNFLSDSLREYGLQVKSDWQVFPIRKRMVDFLSYRFDYHKTIVRKALLYRMVGFLRRVKTHVDAHKARIVMSYKGILKHCDSYKLRQTYLYPNVSIKLCRRLISHADTKRILPVPA